MLRDIHNIQNFNTVHDKNEIPKISASNSHNVKKRTVLSASNSLMVIASNVSFGRSHSFTNNNSSKSKSTIVKDHGKPGEDKHNLKYKYQYNRGSRRSRLSKNCQDSSLQRLSNRMDAFNQSVKETEQTNTHQERKVSDTPTERQYHSPNENSEIYPASQKLRTLSERNQKAQYCQKAISIQPNSVFTPKVTSEVKFSNGFDKIINGINEQFKENLHSVLFEPDPEANLQSTIEESHQLENPEPRTDFRRDSTVSNKCDNKTPIFKIPELPTRRRKSLSAKTASESSNKPKKKKLKDSKRKVGKKVEFQQRQSRNKSLKSDSSFHTILINENWLNTVLGNELDRNILRKFPDLSKFCFSYPFLESYPAERFKIRSDIKELSRPQHNVGQVSQSRNDTVDISGSRNDTGERSQFRNDTEMLSRSQTVTGNAIPSRNDSRDVHLPKVSFSNRSQEDYLNSQASRIENFISNGLVLLENHIHYWYCISCAIPPWSPKLATVLHNLAQQRCPTMCDYLTARYNSERRRPLSEIRERFVEILEAIGYGMIEILDDLRYTLSDGNICDDRFLIPKIMDFWKKIENDYTDLCQEFYNIRDDYHNFHEVWASMGGDYIIVKEIFFTFQESIINLYESF